MRFLFPLLLIAAGIFGLLEHDAINEQWAAMYPEDPARQTALSRCYEEDRLFNRFSATARTICYQKYLQVEMPVTPPGVTVQTPSYTPPTHVVPHAPPLRNNNPNSR
jgi:hypothetical protein